MPSCTWHGAGALCAKHCTLPAQPAPASTTASMVTCSEAQLSCTRADHAQPRVWSQPCVCAQMPPSGSLQGQPSLAAQAREAQPPERLWRYASRVPATFADAADQLLTEGSLQRQPSGLPRQASSAATLLGAVQREGSGLLRQPSGAPSRLSAAGLARQGSALPSSLQHAASGLPRQPSAAPSRLARASAGIARQGSGLPSRLQSSAASPAVLESQQQPERQQQHRSTSEHAALAQAAAAAAARYVAAHQPSQEASPAMQLPAVPASEESAPTLRQAAPAAAQPAAAQPHPERYSDDADWDGSADQPAVHAPSAQPGPAQREPAYRPRAPAVELSTRRAARAQGLQDSLWHELDAEDAEDAEAPASTARTRGAPPRLQDPQRHQHAACLGYCPGQRHAVEAALRKVCPPSPSCPRRRAAPSALFNAGHATVAGSARPAARALCRAATGCRARRASEVLRCLCRRGRPHRHQARLAGQHGGAQAGPRWHAPQPVQVAREARPAAPQNAHGRGHRPAQGCGLRQSAHERTRLSTAAQPACEVQTSSVGRCAHPGVDCSTTQQRTPAWAPLV